jgi:hypothetical protein
MHGRLCVLVCAFSQHPSKDGALNEDTLNSFQFLCMANCVVARHFHASALLLQHPSQDGALNDDELNTFQFLCFGQPLTPDELASVRQMVAGYPPPTYPAYASAS